jgi:hypothetical protein
VFYAAERPGRRGVLEIYHIFRDISTYAVAHSTGNTTGEAGAEPGAVDTIGKVGVETGKGDATGGVGAGPEAGNAISEADAEPGANNAIGEVVAEPGEGDATGEADAKPATRKPSGEMGAEPGAADAIGEVGAEPGAADVIGLGDEIGHVDTNSATDPGGNTIGDEGTEPGMVKWPTARGVSFASTVGPLILLLPGASLTRLAREQVHLLQSIDCRASSEAVQQPSANEDGVHLPGPPIPPVHFNTVPTPRV